jgi:hypothetical protein
MGVRLGDMEPGWLKLIPTTNSSSRAVPEKGNIIRGYRDAIGSALKCVLLRA